MIPIALESRERWFERWVFVNSGATYSVFHPKEITGTGINYLAGERRMIVVGDGGFIDAYFLKLPIRINGHEITAEIGFSERLGVGFNLLGRKDVFDRFRVCFSDARRIISFELNETQA